MCQMAPSILFQWDISHLMGHLTISMRQKVENEIWRLNAYLYDVASTMEFYYLHTAWYMFM